jgi:hypothetical protein
VAVGKPLSLGLLALAMMACSSGSKPSATQATGPGDLSALSPQQQIEKIQSDPNIPPEAKQAGITSIKQKNGLP